MENLATLFVPAMLDGVANGTLVGYVTIEPGTIKRENYEVAAWYRDIVLDPGTYEVRFRKADWQRDYEIGDLVAEVPGVCVKACLVSLFGGVSYGPDEAGRRAVGVRHTVTVRQWLGYTSEKEVRRVSDIAGHLFTPIENLAAQEGKVDA